MDFYPRVLPAFERKIGSQTFSCQDDGLIKDGHAFSSYIQTFLPPLKPKRTKAGKIAACQPRIPTRAKEW
jgi:hypothetical protein